MFLPNKISAGDRAVVVCGVILYWNRNLAIHHLEYPLMTCEIPVWTLVQPFQPIHLMKVIRAQTGQLLEVDLLLDGKPLCMEDDTGAAVSLVSEKTYWSLFPGRCLQPSKACLCTYSGESITVGVEVCYEKQQVKLPLLVVKGEGPSLFGQNWLTNIRLDWGAINTVKCRTLTSVLESYSSVFEPGTLQGYKDKIHVDPGVQPKYCKALSVPYAKEWWSPSSVVLPV